MRKGKIVSNQDFSSRSDLEVRAEGEGMEDGRGICVLVSVANCQ